MAPVPSLEESEHIPLLQSHVWYVLLQSTCSTSADMCTKFNQWPAGQTSGKSQNISSSDGNIKVRRGGVRLASISTDMQALSRMQPHLAENSRERCGGFGCDRGLDQTAWLML